MAGGRAFQLLGYWRAGTKGVEDCLVSGVDQAD